MFSSLKIYIFRTSWERPLEVYLFNLVALLSSKLTVLGLFSGQQCPLGVSCGLSHSLLEQEGASSSAHVRAPYSRCCSDPSR